MEDPLPFIESLSEDILADPSQEPFLLDLLSHLYESTLTEFLPSSLPSYSDSHSIDQLITEDLDDEQIWGQLSYRNDAINSLLSHSESLLSEMPAPQSEDLTVDNTAESDEEIIFSDDEDLDSQEESDVESGSDDVIDDDVAEDDVMDDDVAAEFENEEDEDEMDQYLDSLLDEEIGQNDDVDGQNDDELDLFDELDDGEDVTYEQFFGSEPPPAEPNFDMSEEEFDEDEEENNEDQEELTEEELKIRQLEDESLNQKDWFMRGEVSDKDRPHNSLLSATVDFDTGIARKVVDDDDYDDVEGVKKDSQNSQNSIEEMIKQRIKDGLFDDPVKVTIDQKSDRKDQKDLDDSGPGQRQSLGDVYEQDFLKIRGFVNDAELVELRQNSQILLDNIMLELDKLTQTKHGFAIKQLIPDDIEIKKNNIASMEASDSTAVSLHPHQLADQSSVNQRAKGVVTSQEELSKEERKAKRRAKKERNKGKVFKKKEGSVKNKGQNDGVKYGRSSEFFKLMDQNK
ncbi:hypothetical protein P9112_006037 [Eukaryota sp. TZLM1-RC]